MSQALFRTFAVHFHNEYYCRKLGRLFYKTLEPTNTSGQLHAPTGHNDISSSSQDTDVDQSHVHHVNSKRLLKRPVKLKIWRRNWLANTLKPPNSAAHAPEAALTDFEYVVFDFVQH